MPEPEVSEVAIRIRDFSQETAFAEKLEGLLGKEVNQKGKPIFDVHTWEKLSPFYNIARMIDVMSIFVKVMLIAVVLISIMNVMIMAVYERVREIGTIAGHRNPAEKDPFHVCDRGLLPWSPGSDHRQYHRADHHLCLEPYRHIL